MNAEDIKSRLSRIACLGNQAERITQEVLAIIAEVRGGNVSIPDVQQVIQDARKLGYNLFHEVQAAGTDYDGIHDINLSEIATVEQAGVVIGKIEGMIDHGLLAAPDVVETVKATAYSLGHAEGTAAAQTEHGVHPDEVARLVNDGRNAAKEQVVAAVAAVAEQASGPAVKGAVNKALEAAKAVTLLESATSSGE